MLKEESGSVGDHLVPLGHLRPHLPRHLLPVLQTLACQASPYVEHIIIARYLPVAKAKGPTLVLPMTAFTPNLFLQISCLVLAPTEAGL